MEPGFPNAIPNWLDMLMKMNFFDPCFDHQLKLKEKNWLCLDCCISFCLLCSNHSNHRALRIRKYNSHEVVKAEEMEKLINCSLIQPYKLNRASVVFLKAHPSKKKEILVEENVQNQYHPRQENHTMGEPLEGSVRVCSCSCSLVVGYKYCSVACKVNQLLRTEGSINHQLRYFALLSLPSDQESNEQQSAKPSNELLTVGNSSHSMHNGTESSEFSRGKRKKNSEASHSGPLRYFALLSLPSDQESNEQRSAKPSTELLTVGNSSHSMHIGTESSESSRGERKKNSETSHSGPVIVHSRRKGVPCRSPSF